MKGKGERERCTQLNAEFQRIAKRDKKAFLSEQCTEIEENNKMGKTRDLFEKTRHTKGTFYAKIGTIKDKNGKDKKQKQKRLIKDGKKYTEELYNKALNDPNNHYGVLTHLEPEILECEVSWALGSITTNKASGDDGIPTELFEILNDDAVKMLHSTCQQI